MQNKNINNIIRQNLQCSFPSHQRQVEAFCKECNKFICATCIFNPNNEHKSHSFVSLDDTALYFRRILDDHSHILRKEYTDERVIEIKQAKIEFELETKKLIERIDYITNCLVNSIQTRRNQIIELIEKNFFNELEKIRYQEQRWSEKANISKNLQDIWTDYCDENVIKNIQLINRGLEKLQEDVSTKEIIVLNDFELNLFIQANDTKKEKVTRQSSANTSASLLQSKQSPSDVLLLSLEQLTDAVSRMFKLSDPILVPFKS